jgi:diguanylate cyclase (GGDEF)-like protein/PAS domain S-box-containing protein
LSFKDLNDKTEEKKILEKIVSISEEFLQSTGNALDYQKITDNILEISGAKYACFNLFDEDGNKFKTVAFSAPEGAAKKISSILGFKLIGRNWDPDPISTEKIKASNIIHFSSLLELSENAISKSVVSLSEKTLNLGEVVLVKILKENVMIGDFILFMPRNAKFKNDNYIEIFTRQLGLLITRKRSEEALRKSEEKFSKAFHSGAVLMSISTVEDGRIIDANDAFLKTLGFDRDEVIGKTSNDLGIFVDKGQRAEFIKIFDDKGRVSNLEVPIKGRDGIIHTGIFTIDPIDIGEKACWLTTVTDITERKKADEALRESEEKFRDLAQMLPEPVYEMNIHGILTFANQQAFEVFGYTPEDFARGINALDMLIQEDRDRAQKVIGSLFQGENSVPSEYTAQRIDGSTFPILISSSAILHQGKVTGIRGLIFDITERKRAEEALEESKKTIERYLNIAAEIIISLDTLGNITLINDSGLLLLGYEKDELIGRNWFKTCLPHEMISDISGVFEKLMNGDIENVSSYENVVKTKSGEIRVILWHNTLLRDSGGNITGTISSGEDITARKKVEDLLRKGHERLANILEGTNVGTWEWNVQTGETIYNERWAEIIGYKLNEIPPVCLEIWENFIHPDDVKKPGEQLNKVFSGERDYYDAEMRIKHKDGRWVWVHDRGKVISWTPDGKPLWMNGTYTDITERKKVEEALLASEERFSKAFKTSPYAIAITRLKGGKFIEINDAFLNITGFTREEVFAASTISLNLWVNSENRDWVVATLKKGIEVKDKEFQFRKKNGEIMTGLFSAQVIHINNEDLFLSSITDITERKKTEEEIIRLSFHDHLTGLYNRRFFEEELKRLDTDRQLPLSFIMGDLNSLKIINDVFGHNQGDELLKEAAEILRTICRSDDILARWGGDEFVILLPKTSISGAEDVVERIKKECRKTRSKKVPVSLSLGVATKEIHDQDIQSIVIDAESNMYKNKLAQKDSLTSSVIFALEQALYEKSSETKEHTDRMHELAIKLGKSSKLASHQLDELSLLASLHDIGKVAIPEKILLKKGKLTEKEWDAIKRHPEIGFNIAQSSPQIAHIAKAILSCHENWDGSGYPLGLKGDSIPIISRIILIVDAYDVMTSGRSYKPAMIKDDAIAELKRCAGGQFDPALVDKFINILQNRKSGCGNSLILSCFFLGM